QWRHRAGNGKSRGTYMSSYGELRLDAVASFETEIPYHGILPSLPHEPSLRPTLARLLESEVPGDLPKEIKDTYWTGKDMGKWAAMHRTALAIGKTDWAATAADRIRRTLERWFTPSTAAADNAVFAYDREWSTLIGYPAGFGTDTDLNDHHFHYGYFVQAAAELARVDPGWAAPKRYGAMLAELIDDMACADRNHPRYPYLRCFDIYAGHSWASGNAPFASGNNQESSSEAINAWAGMALLGTRTGDTALRDRGICLYATEVAALSEYWLDVHRTLPAAYPCPQFAMVWGGKRVHETWFSNRPEAIHAINWLPFTPASLYLGLYPDSAKRNHDALMAETGGDLKQWKDLIWMHQALHDPDGAIAAWKREASTYEPEVGQSRAAVIEWMGFLRAYGQVDRTVHLNTVCYAVLRKSNVRTFVVWNPGKSRISVRATDGTRLTVPAGGPHVFQRRV
ncbi:MAG: glycosyl hydrolase, partial [Armatimonadaceae bacterium]